jgi:uncharacterized LabA/DUF88 family protein
MLKATITQRVAILIDGNDLEQSVHKAAENDKAMLNFDKLIPKVLNGRGLDRLVYFREGRNISSKLSHRLNRNFHGSVRSCYKSADIPLSITAMQIASKVDAVIIISGNPDFVELIRSLKSTGVRVEISSIKGTTASVLVNESDYFHGITSDCWFLLGEQQSQSQQSDQPQDQQQSDQPQDQPQDQPPQAQPPKSQPQKSRSQKNQSQPQKSKERRGKKQPQERDDSYYQNRYAEKMGFSDEPDDTDEDDAQPINYYEG